MSDKFKVDEGVTIPKESAVNQAGPSEDMAWAIISTLVAGPVVWGGIGVAVDSFVGTSRVFLPIGIVLGSIVSFYIVYVRFGRNSEPDQGEK